ncbi:MAG TPA: hypothetical protein VG370_01120 [Chloroflexota bacterium]|nr:hypothetical protein [Chloroflexota bacterium]
MESKMRKLLGIGLAGLLGLSSLAPPLAATALAQEAVAEDVLGVQARRDFDNLGVETKIDLVRALVARGQLVRQMARVGGGGEGEAVLGEQAKRGQVTDEMLQEMLAQLRARAELSREMGELPSGGWQSMPR